MPPLRPYRTLPNLAAEAVASFTERGTDGCNEFCRRDTIGRHLYADLHQLVRKDRFQAVLYHDTEIALQSFWQAHREAMIDAVVAREHVIGKVAA